MDLPGGFFKKAKQDGYLDDDGEAGSAAEHGPPHDHCRKRTEMAAAAFGKGEAVVPALDWKTILLRFDQQQDTLGSGSHS